MNGSTMSFIVLEIVLSEVVVISEALYSSTKNRSPVVSLGTSLEEGMKTSTWGHRDKGFWRTHDDERDSNHLIC